MAIFTSLSLFFCVAYFSFSSISFFEGGCGFEEYIFLDQEDVHTNLECGGNTPNIDGWIELLDTDNRINSKITVQIKHLPTGQRFYSIPQYICGYAERIKSEVVVSTIVSRYK